MRFFLLSTAFLLQQQQRWRLVAGLQPPPPLAAPQQFDVLVYGATSGGVVAAVAASRHGYRVGLLVANGGGCGPSEAGANHIGGMSSSGLGKTDIGAAATGQCPCLEEMFRLRQYETPPLSRRCLTWCVPVGSPLVFNCMQKPGPFTGQHHLPVW